MSYSQESADGDDQESELAENEKVSQFDFQIDL